MSFIRLMTTSQEHSCCYKKIPGEPCASSQRVLRTTPYYGALSRQLGLIKMRGQISIHQPVLQPSSGTSYKVQADPSQGQANQTCFHHKCHNGDKSSETCQHNVYSSRLLSGQNFFDFLCLVISTKRMNGALEKLAHFGSSCQCIGLLQTWAANVPPCTWLPFRSFPYVQILIWCHQEREASPSESETFRINCI